MKQKLYLIISICLLYFSQAQARTDYNVNGTPEGSTLTISEISTGTLNAGGGRYATIIDELSSYNVTYSYDAGGNRTSRITAVSAAFSSAPEYRSSVVKDQANGLTFDPGPDDSKDEKTVENTIGIDLESPSQPVVTVYPNPTDGLLTVSTANCCEATPVEIRLYNSAGKILYSRKTASGKEIIDLSAYTQGLYMVVISACGKVETHKILKESK
jgi:hypothetical protein